MGGLCATNARRKTKNKSYGDKSALPLRGGSWNNSSWAGVFALNFNNPRVLSNDNVGFRAALPLKPDIQSLRVLFQSKRIKGFAPLLNRTNLRITFGNGPALPLRGGNWTDQARAGVFALLLNNPRVNSNANVGFRAALPSEPDTQCLRVLCQCRGDKGGRFHAVQVRQKTKISWKPLVARRIAG